MKVKGTTWGENEGKASPTFLPACVRHTACPKRREGITNPLTSEPSSKIKVVINNKQQRQTMPPARPSTVHRIRVRACREKRGGWPEKDGRGELGGRGLGAGAGGGCTR